MKYTYLDVDNILMRTPDGDPLSISTFEKATPRGWEPSTMPGVKIVEKAGVISEKQAKLLAAALGVRWA